MESSDSWKGLVEKAVMVYFIIRRSMKETYLNEKQNICKGRDKAGNVRISLRKVLNGRLESLHFTEDWTELGKDFGMGPSYFL